MICGSGSVVERYLAKVVVASSNLVSRSIFRLDVIPFRGAKSLFSCGRGEIGRRVRFRFLCPLGHGGSSPLDRTKNRQISKEICRFFLFLLHFSLKFVENISAEITSFISLLRFTITFHDSLLLFTLTLGIILSGMKHRRKAVVLCRHDTAAFSFNLCQ